MQTGFQKQSASGFLFIFKCGSILVPVGIATCFSENVRCWLACPQAMTPDAGYIFNCLARLCTPGVVDYYGSYACKLAFVRLRRNDKEMASSMSFCWDATNE